MREHCRTQHEYDPFPGPQTSPFPSLQNDPLLMPAGGTSKSLSPTTIVQEKFLEMMLNSRFQQTRIWVAAGEPTLNSVATIEDALTYLLDNFVVVRKKEFQGISGYYCKICLSFEYRYIGNIWDEMSAKDRHVHHAHIAPYDATRPAKEIEGSVQANRLLLELANTLFGRDKKFDVYPCFASTNFRGPVIKLDYLDSSHWAGFAILTNGLVPDELHINNFITNVGGTYAQIIVASGQLTGTYIFSVQSNK